MMIYFNRLYFTTIYILFIFSQTNASNSSEEIFPNWEYISNHTPISFENITINYAAFETEKSLLICKIKLSYTTEELQLVQTEILSSSYFEEESLFYDNLKQELFVTTLIKGISDLANNIENRIRHLHAYDDKYENFLVKSSNYTSQQFGNLKIRNYAYSRSMEYDKGKNVEESYDEAIICEYKNQEIVLINGKLISKIDMKNSLHRGEKENGLIPVISESVRKWLNLTKNVIVTIGINKYPKRTDLNYAVNDAKSINEYFVTNCNYVNYAKLYDGAATKENILSIIDKLRNDNSIDRIIFFFAGHGHTETSAINYEELGFFLPVNYDPNNIFTTAISMGEISTWARSLQARHVLFIFDTCFSGMLGETVRGRDYTLDFLAENKGRHTITAGTKDQEAREYQALKHGALTYYILKGLKGAADKLPTDGIITLDELIIYLQNEVTNFTKKRQRPKLIDLVGEKGQLFIEIKK